MNASRLSLPPLPRYTRLSEVVRAFSRARSADEVHQLVAECAHGVTRSDQAVVYTPDQHGMRPSHSLMHGSSPALARLAALALQSGELASGEPRDDDEIQFSLADPIVVDGTPMAVVAVGRWSLPFGSEMPGRLRVVTVQAGRALTRLRGQSA